jgi:hypothetical protein
VSIAEYWTGFIDLVCGRPVKMVFVSWARVGVVLVTCWTYLVCSVLGETVYDAIKNNPDLSKVRTLSQANTFKLDAAACR